MKKQLISLAIFLIVMHIIPVYAGGPVFEKVILDESDLNKNLRVRFTVNTDNPELKRAWVVAFYNEPVLRDAEGILPKAVDISIPGLSYSPDTKEIIYTKSDGNKIVCADKIETGFFRGLSFRETGKCILDTSKAYLTDDNGFEIKKKRGLKISLLIHE